MKKSLFAVLAVLVAGYAYAANYWELRDKTNTTKVTINDSFEVQGTSPLQYKGDGSALTGVVATDVADGSITSTKLANNAVVAAKIEDGAVTTNKLGNGAVTDGKVVSLSASKLTGALPAIDGSQLTGVVASSVADGSITSTKLANNAVVAAKIEDGAVTTNKLGDGAVTTNKVANNSITNEKVVSIDGTKLTGGPITISGGSTAAPAYSNTAETNTGVYMGAGYVGVTVGGVAQIVANPSALNGVGILGVSFVGKKTTAELQSYACNGMLQLCLVFNSTDFDLYTSTGTGAGQFRNTRTGMGPQ